jgi:hypothetical protein
MMKNHIPYRWLYPFLALAVALVSGTALASGDSDHTSLRKDAARELEIAIAAVDEATRRKALWIPAVDALESAKTAYETGDFEQVIEQARMATEFAELGIRQLGYPPYRPF